MRLASNLTSAIGLAAFSVTLLLSAPGVQIARAGEASSAEFDRFLAYTRSEAQRPDLAATATATATEKDGPSCAVGRRPAGESMSETMARALRQLALQTGGGQEPVDPTKLTSLNGRGYNYGLAPMALDHTKLQLELRQPR
ncbi:MAG: hypothetical protein O7A09_07100 [Proteobacteria bacterium]|nr:hypothetical protein [Pseudomonadota bacterium]